MQNNRKKSYRTKHRKLIVAWKIFAICYTFLFTASYLSSNTSAYFNTQTVASSTIAAGVWDKEVEKASLSFKNASNQNSKTCPGMIHVSLENTGDKNMQKAGTYTIYYAEKDDPKNGKELKKAPIRVLTPGDTMELDYEATKPGTYIFKAAQSDEDSIWSKQFKLTCSNETNEKAGKAGSSKPESGENKKDKQHAQKKQ
ncbi:amyloid fiber anchoring/assembly protein TapA [Virgibacillus halophilus]|uniref:Amyloid fiber anchoring/assembly protein TapA n=1 Tax=Tigheibacillus halophilus TaxID=361280 RepID=A0ABU5C335_9BACI|nr:amyloid fiber anchoring/assembly protein TapA [Virgibacillus halophilus]